MRLADYLRTWRGPPSPVKPGLTTAKAVIAGLERDFDVNGLLYNGIRIWPWLRNALIFYYVEERGPLLAQAEKPTDSIAPDESEDLLARADRWRGVFNHREAGASALAALPQADILFVRQGEARNVQIDGHAIDTRFDPLIRCVDGKQSWLKLYLTPERAAVLDRYPARFADPMPYLKWLRDLDGAHQALLRHDQENAFSGMDELRRRLPRLAHLPEAPSLGNVAPSMLTIASTASYFDEVLQQVKPRLVVSTGHNLMTHALFLACRRKGVKSADVQHGAGATSPNNLKWFGWRRVPEDGYELLPDHFLVWDNTAAQRIATSSNQPQKHSPIVVGDQWLSYGRDLARPADATHLTILVTLTQLDIAPPPAHLIDAVARAPSGWRWHIRLHPSDLESKGAVERVAAMFGKHANIEVHESSIAPLPMLLAGAQRHVTMYSSVAVEASAFGLGTIFIDGKARDFFGWLLKEPGFALAQTGDRLLALLVKGLPTPRRIVESEPAIAEAAFEKLLGPKAPENSAAS